jgi:hypothetical protein
MKKDFKTVLKTIVWVIVGIIVFLWGVMTLVSIELKQYLKDDGALFMIISFLIFMIGLIDHIIFNVPSLKRLDMSKSDDERTQRKYRRMIKSKRYRMIIAGGLSAICFVAGIVSEHNEYETYAEENGVEIEIIQSNSILLPDQLRISVYPEKNFAWIANERYKALNEVLSGICYEDISTDYPFEYEQENLGGLWGSESFELEDFLSENIDEFKIIDAKESFLLAIKKGKYSYRIDINYSKTTSKEEFIWALKESLERLGLA